MAIFFVVGKPGGGKSYYGVKQMVEELLRSNRYVVTNIELLLPELRQLLHEETGSEFDFQTVGDFSLAGDVAEMDLNERVRVLDDGESSEFWNYEPGRDFLKRREVKRGGKTMDVPDFEDRAKRGCLYVIDEVHVLFGAREWQNTGADCTFFLSQHRKLRCDVIFITQHPDQVDKALRRLAQDYVQMRNLSREPIFGFRVGSIFRWSRSMNSPTGGNPRVFESGFIKLDVTRFGKVYDTMQGIGIQGRVSPTVEKKGRSPWWLVIPAVVVITLVLFGPRWAMGLGHGLMRHFVGGALEKFQPSAMVHVTVPANAVTAVPAATTTALASRPLVKSEGRLLNDNGNANTNPVLMSGYIRLGGVLTVYLSDGRNYHLGDGECTELNPAFCVINERIYRAARPPVGKPLEAAAVAHGQPLVSASSGVRQRTLRLHMQDGEVFEKPLPEPSGFVWQDEPDRDSSPVGSERTSPVLGPVSTGSLSGSVGATRTITVR